MKTTEYAGHTRDPFHTGYGDVPGEQGAVGGAHSETHHQSVLRRTIQKRERQVRHDLGEGSQFGDAHAVDQQRLVPAFSDGNDGGGVVTKNDAMGELVFVTLAAE